MTDQRSDRELARMVVEEGDEEAFRALYRRHTPTVYRFVLRLVGGDVAEAEDLRQETWMRAALWRSLSSGEHGSSSSMQTASGFESGCRQEAARPRRAVSGFADKRFPWGGDRP